MQKTTSSIFMIRPVSFGYNKQTAKTNSFQKKSIQLSESVIQTNARKEFDNLVRLLKTNNINVTIFEDTVSPHTPDAIFPNNWISFHDNNTIVLYPMLAKNRRKERRGDIINYFKKKETTLIDLSAAELQTIFLEGTGSVVFDYVNKIAYANISPRTNQELFKKLCTQLNYKEISFEAVDKNNQAIYHTNVLMCIGNTFSVLCKDCISKKEELETVIQSLQSTNHEIIEISYQQMAAFAGNMYQLFNEAAQSFILMSEQAFKSLEPKQIRILEKHGKIIYVPLYTIETYGGGSARCMIVDVSPTYLYFEYSYNLLV